MLIDYENSKENTQHKVKRKAGSIIFFALAVLLIIMQITYFIYNRNSNYEYIADWMLYTTNAIILIFIFLSVFFLFRGKKTTILISSIILSVLFCFNLILMMLYGFANTSIVTLSPDIQNITILKQDNETGEVTVYRNSILLFARLYEQLPDTVEGEVKTQWLTSDVCTVTYKDNKNVLHQYVGTYGDRGNGAYYYTVSDVIRGKWAFDSYNTNDKTITTDETGITIKDGDTTLVYDYEDCVQYGTLAVVLCRDGLPEWTIALNEDCKVVSGLHILDDDGTITLCAVSAEETAALTYFRTYNPLAEALVQEEQDETDSQEQISAPKTTETLSSDFSGLEKYNSVFGVMELDTDSSDVFEIGRIALAEGHKQTGAANSDTELQITQMKLLAGDISEFLIEVQANGSNDLGTSLEYNWTFRIKKGNGVFGAVRVADNADGTEGLTVLDTPQSMNMSDNPDYFIFIAANITDEEEQQGLVAAQLMADILSDSPDLSNFESQQGLVKVQTDSADLFMISRMAAEENLKMFAINGYDNDVQITRIILIAGDQNEFLIKVHMSAVITQQDTSETVQYIPTYRIKKGDGVYLAMVSGYDKVNSVGLNIVDPPQVKNVAEDADYHFVVPAA